ncbi:hypothetical protein SAMN05720473_104197 [Fibrobacter sp. UWB15]|uniref:hypothetical protein n=1 Tax=unclassified Fibrobacter TaxID=2634177 RepID=UPI0009181C36|nr:MULTISPECIES: hypothetical protein [unclassified Fibrobacter]PWJ64093.1 hypothetical protein BGW99_1068 [Fibrobacter sp. UWB6]SHG20778.1 hypothetical protein SAMN05720760_1068 [Fibrobacter sp. UWB8]SMG29229.1 hypothetical protein SAMN05720473_104197 [Fibrobacter sp. UWB15]
MKKKNKWYEVLGAGLLSVSAMYLCTSLMVTGCSSESSSVAGDDSEEYIEDVESGGDEGASSSSVASKDKKAKSSSSEKNEKIESSSSENNGSSDTTRVESSSSEKADSSSVEEYAIKNMTLTGVAQKGPFVDGHGFVREVDCETLRPTSYDAEFGYFSVVIEDGVINVENLNMVSPCAEIVVWGYYLDEHTGEKSKKLVNLSALANLENRSTVNVNVFTQLEYDRMKYLVNQKKMPVAEAKALAKKEILALFDIKDDVGDFADLDILKPGEGNAALLAASVLLTAQTDPEKNAHLTYTVDSLSDSYVKTGEWDNEMKTKIANWAKSAKENGTLETIRKNVAGWKNVEAVPEFEKYVEKFGEEYSSPENEESSKESSHPREWHELHDIIYHYVLEENTPETLDKEKYDRIYRENEQTNLEEYLMDEDAYMAEFVKGNKYSWNVMLTHDPRMWDGDEWDDPRYPNVHYEVWLDTMFVWSEYGTDKIYAIAGYMIRYTVGEAPDVEERIAYVEVRVNLNWLNQPYNPSKKEDD